MGTHQDNVRDDQRRNTGEGQYEEEIDEGPAAAACGPAENARFATISSERQILQQQVNDLQSDIAYFRNDPGAVADIMGMQRPLRQQIQLIDQEMQALRAQCG